MNSERFPRFRAILVCTTCGLLAATTAIALAQKAGSKLSVKDEGVQTAQAAAAQPSETRREKRADRHEAKKAKRRAVSLGMQLQGNADQLQVTTVEENGLAAQAGIQQNDRIISVDGHTFANARQLDAYLASQGGRRVPIVVERSGQRMTVTASPPQLAADSAWLGVYLQEGEPNTRGAQVTQVYPTGPGARAGLHPGDTIVQVDSQQIESPADLITLVQESEPQQQMEFTLMRNNQSTKIPVTLGSRHDYRPQQSHQMNYQANYPRTYANDQGQQAGGQFEGEDEYSDVPPHAMGLENDRRMAEQHQRIEDEIRQLREEIQKLREELKKK